MRHRLGRPPVRCSPVPDWLPPLAVASFVVLLLNVALLVQRARERAQDWPAQLLRDLRHWDGYVPGELEHTTPGEGDRAVS